MTDSPERALEEAEGWLASAKHTYADSEEGDVGAIVCCSQTIHGMIRANDALCLKFFGNKPTRHDDAAAFYAKMLRERKLPASAEPFKNLASKAMREKSSADYGKSSFSRDEAQEYLERTEEFVAMVKGVVKH